MSNQYSAAHVARQLAIEQGLKRYEGDTPCKHCGSRIKYTSSMGCVDCNITRNLPKLMDAATMAPYRTEAKAKARLDGWRQQNPTLHATQWLRAACKRYGITLEQYYTLAEQQQFRCKICKRPCVKGRLSIDHCHKTNVVRGLLCRKCNLALGNFEDDIMRLNAAIEYLKGI